MVMIRRTLTTFAALGLVAGIIARPTAPAAAATPSCPGSAPAQHQVDVNGDGHPDLASMLGDTLVVRDGNGGPDQHVSASSLGLTTSSESGPNPGFAVINPNHDGCSDIAFGVPQLMDNGVEPGGVQILWGSHDGLQIGPLTKSSDPDVPGGTQNGMYFGAALAGTDDSLAVGAPGWDFQTGSDSVDGTGEAVKVTLTPAGTIAPGLGRLMRLDRPSEFASLGTTVTDGGAGAPYTHRRRAAYTGCVVLAAAVPNGRTYCAPHRGDSFGQSLAFGHDPRHGSVLYVGAPSHDVGKRLGTGAVYEYAVKAGRRLAQVATFTEATKHVPGVAENGDKFGSVLATRHSHHRDQLVIGVPFETFGKHKGDGAVTILDRHRHHARWRVLSRAQSGVIGGPQRREHFGNGLWITRTSLLVGVPGHDNGSTRDAGQIQIFTDRPAHGVKPTGSRVEQVEPPVALGRWGAVLE
jgi:hypothetical protein